MRVAERPRLIWALLLALTVVFATTGALLATQGTPVTRPGPASAPITEPTHHALSSVGSKPSRTSRQAHQCASADPCHIAIPAISVDTTVAAKPTETRWDPFLNKTVPSFGVPDNLTTTTWWSSGPRPGGTGMAVVLGHYYSAGYGVFNHLGTLHAGDQITIDEGKTVLRYRVSSIDDYLPKTDANALSDALRSNAATAQLALISCTGAANQTYHEIEANVVVFARLLPHTTN